MHLTMRRDEEDMKQAQAIKIGKVLNPSSALVCRDLTLVDTIKALVNYAGVFDLEYGVKSSASS